MFIATKAFYKALYCARQKSCSSFFLVYVIRSLVLYYDLLFLKSGSLLPLRGHRVKKYYTITPCKHKNKFLWHKALINYFLLNLLVFSFEIIKTTV